MGAIAAPIIPGKLGAWEAWIAEINGSRRADFEASNARHGLTSHRAWLQENPDGGHVVVAVHDGPGADHYMASLSGSSDPFDQWFVAGLAEVHGIDLNGPPPPQAKQML